jgi:hypothetical protein
MSDETGGNAFPTTTDHYEGMTLRDYFAAHASDDDLLEQAEVIRSNHLEKTGFAILPDGWRVKARYMHADAMLKERAK